MNEAELLPREMLAKAYEWPDLEPGWRMNDVPAVVEAARTKNLANLGGQPQFRGPLGVAEPYWLNYEPSNRHEGETWEEWVERSAKETLEAFNTVCSSANFVQEAKQWRHIRKNMSLEATDPLAHLWFLLYFQAKS